jgi:1-acyl-sn-glycerol-3-phosphate acyltransferase
MDVAFSHAGSAVTPLPPLPVVPAPKPAPRLPLPARPHRPAHLRLVRTTPPLLARRDQGLIRRAFPWLTRLTDHYYRAEVQGVEHLSDQASLIVSTHNGGMYTPDAYCLAVAFWRRFGLETPAYGLMHKTAFRVPLMGWLLPRLGAIHASRENAATVLAANHPLLVCPGGDIDALKPFSQRHRIVFGQRMGFVALALRHRVPIVPVVSVGAHETLFFVNDGRWLAEKSGLARLLRVKAVPLALSFPFGLTPAGLFAIPLPSKVTLRVLPPIHFDEPAAAADDPAVVQRCFARVVATMQAALDDLAAQRKHVVLG